MLNRGSYQKKNFFFVKNNREYSPFCCSLQHKGIWLFRTDETLRSWFQQSIFLQSNYPSLRRSFSSELLQQDCTLYMVRKTFTRTYASYLRLNLSKRWKVLRSAWQSKLSTERVSAERLKDSNTCLSVRYFPSRKITVSFGSVCSFFLMNLSKCFSFMMALWCMCVST